MRSLSPSCPVYLLAAGSRNHRLGAAYCGDETRVLVPVEAGPELVNPLTDERLAVTRGTLPLARAFASFPVTLLLSAA